MEDDDEERSRSIPSRTKLGKRAAIISKFPFLGNPLVLLGGIVTIPCWEYRNTSLAMLDIMMSDMPRVEYGKEKITSSDIRDSERKNRDIAQRVKNGKGIGANLSKAINTKNYLKSRTR